MLRSFISFSLLIAIVLIESSAGYSALEDARIIAEYKRQKELDHAKIARRLVHQSNWASVGTISTNSKVHGYPMVNIISVDDNDISGKSTGNIHFMLTDLDFTGPDWRASNKVTFLFTDEQNKNCARHKMDPMEPTCARTIISGRVVEMNVNTRDYKDALSAFVKRHPAAQNWMKAHNFYINQLEIQNIFVLDFYGGPHEVTLDQYLNAYPDNDSENVE